jgi:hypothetical protein
MIILYAHKDDHSAGFAVSSEDLASSLARWLTSEGWRVIEDYAPLRLTAAEHEAAAHLTRQFQASLGDIFG